MWREAARRDSAVSLPVVAKSGAPLFHMKNVQASLHAVAGQDQVSQHAKGGTLLASIYTDD
jgi:hypothetical protein